MPKHPEHEAARRAMQLHNPPAHPHWSEAVDWPADRWDPMVNAPRAGYPILHVRGRQASGQVIEPIHYACGDGDGLMPAFDGWFLPVLRPDGTVSYYQQVTPVEWQPLRAATRQAEDPRAAAVAESYGYVTHGG